MYKRDAVVPRTGWTCWGCWAAFKRYDDFQAHDCDKERQRRRDELAAARLREKQP